MKTTVHLKAVTLQSGDTLDVDVEVETWGSLESRRVVLVCHALTGSAHVMSHDEDDEPGWWEIHKDSGLLDQRRCLIVAQNVLGGCNGTTGPASLAKDGRPYGERFPQVTIRDMVKVQRAALKSLGITHVDLVVGGSLGGMQALEWAFIYPENVERVLAVGAPLQSDPGVVAFNAVQRAAIELDAEHGLDVARMLAMITYRSRDEFSRRFGRRRDGDRFCVESYLHHHGQALRQRFDPVSYKRLSQAMDGHDVFAGRRSLPQARPAIHLVGIEPDVLFPAPSIKDDARHLKDLGWPVRYGVLRTDVGHDAFLIDPEGLVRAAKLTATPRPEAFKVRQLARTRAPKHAPAAATPCLDAVPQCKP